MASARRAAPRTKKAAKRESAPKPLRPVVLVHGILGQRLLYWNVFRHRLRSDGFDAYEAQLPYSMLGDIPNAAQRLQERITSILAELPPGGDGKVDLVCHSAGGIVALHYLKRLLGAQHVGHIILLGAPHKGTYFSYTMPVLRISTQVRPGSSYLRELGEAEFPAGVEVTNLWSPLDGVIIPAENSSLDHPRVRNVRVPWMHHWGFLISDRVYAQVKAALTGTGGPAP